METMALMAADQLESWADAGEWDDDRVAVKALDLCTLVPPAVNGHDAAMLLTSSSTTAACGA
jgi:hypothetical protein